MKYIPILSFFIAFIFLAACGKADSQKSEVNSAKTKNETVAIVDTLKPLKDKDALAVGKTLYLENCAACHNEDGTGGIGPDLTDTESLHGNDYNSIVKITTYGIPEKGMVAWEKIFTEEEILQVSSYVYFLQEQNKTE